MVFPLSQYFDLGVLNLEIKPNDEERFEEGDEPDEKRRKRRRWLWFFVLAVGLLALCSKCLRGP